MAKRTTKATVTRTLELTTLDAFLTVFRLRALGYKCTYPGAGEAFSLWRENGATIVVRMRQRDGSFPIHAEADEGSLGEIIATVRSVAEAA